MTDKNTESTTAKRITVACPHCGEYIRVTIGVEARAFYQPTGSSEMVSTRNTSTGTGAEIKPEIQLTEGQREVLEIAKRTGLLDAFETVVRWVRAKEGGEAVPKDIKMYFLNFWGKARPRMVPRPVLNLFLSEFPCTQIDFWMADGIAAVCSDGTIRYFIDQALILGKRIENTRVRLGADEKTCAEWIRTRFGFVASKGALFEEMQQKSIGGFGRTIAP